MSSQPSDIVESQPTEQTSPLQGHTSVPCLLGKFKYAAQCANHELAAQSQQLPILTTNLEPAFDSPNNHTPPLYILDAQPTQQRRSYSKTFFPCTTRWLTLLGPYSLSCRKMGQNQSAEKPSSSRGGTSHNDKSDRDRRVHRRISVQALQRSQPADASATTVAAQGNTAASSHNLDMTNLEKMLQSSSPDLVAKPSRAEDSSTKGPRQKKQTDATPIPQDGIASGPAPAVPGSIDIPPTATPIARTRQEELEADVRPAYEERTYIPVSHHRPPRLPLPIAEVQTPDSPSLLPVDKGDEDVPIFHSDPNDSTLPRRNSMLSVATQEEEEDVGEELQPYGVGFTGQTVPTTIEWRGPAERVFVTGTFAAWDRKYRLKKR